MSIRIERKLVKWGHGYGVRLTADEVRRLGLKAGRRVRATVEEATPRNDVAKATLFRFKQPYDIRGILEEETT